MQAFVDGAASFWPAMATHLWQTTAILLVLAVVARALRGASARLLSVFWWIALIKLFLPLQWLGGLTERLLAGLSAGPAAIDATAAGAVRVWFYPLATVAGGPAAGSGARAFYAALTVAWLVIASFLLLRLIASSGRAAQRARPRARAHRLDETLRAALRGTDIPAGVVVMTEEAAMPAVAGLLRPRIRIPVRVVETLGVHELRAVLLHEDAHRRRRDPLRSVLLGLAGIPFFFYPPAWWLIRKIRETSEMACDEAALAAGLSVRDYTRCVARVLNLGLSQDTPVAALHGRGSTLRRRFERLRSQGRSTTMPRHRLILCIASLVVLLGSVIPVVPTPVAAHPTSGDTEAAFDMLDGLASSKTTVSKRFDNTRLQAALQSLARLGGFQISGVDALPDRRLSMNLKGVTIKEALARVALEAGLGYRVVDGTTLQVRVSGPLLAGVGDVTHPTLIPESKVEPAYPESMRSAGKEGSVILQVLIDETGRITETEVLKAAPDDLPELIDSATSAVSQWRYEPAMQGDKPVAVYFTVFIEYSLGDKETEAPLR